MKSFRQLLVLFLSTLLLFGLLYPLFIWSIGRLTPYNSDGRPVSKNGHVVGYQNIGQLFKGPGYFHGRPSASNYNDDPSEASNYGPSNPIFLRKVRQRMDTILSQNPGITRSDIPVDLVTSSGSGIDPDISPQAAFIQIQRIAKARKLPTEELRKLVIRHIDSPLLGVLGPTHINVLLLNIDLDKISANGS